MLFGGFCTDTANIWHLLGLIITLLKIVIPLILIILGMVDLGKAVVSSDEKAISKSVSTLLKRFIAAVVIFFVPTIINALFNVIEIAGGTDNADYKTCVDCITATCKEKAQAALGVKN